jgi:hypothetical protein
MCSEAAHLARRVTGWCIVATLLGAGSALAAESPAARSLFDAGLQLMDQGKPAEACPKFEESLRLQPSIGAELNLARCHEAIGLLATAWTEYKKAASMARAAGDSERETVATDFSNAVEPKVPKLVVNVAQLVPGLKVTRDGQEIGAATYGVPLAVDPGKHRIEATAPGHKDWSTELDVPAAPGPVQVAVPALEPDPSGSSAAGQAGGSAAEADSGNALGITGIVLTATGVVAAGLGALFGGLAASDVGNAQDDPTLCPDKQCSPAGRSAIDSAEGKATASTVLLPVGGALAVAGIVMLVVSATGSSEGQPSTNSGVSARIAPTLAPGSAGLVVVGRF